MLGVGLERVGIPQRAGDRLGARKRRSESPSVADRQRGVREALSRGGDVRAQRNTRLTAVDVKSGKFGLELDSSGKPEDFRREEREDRADLWFRKKTKGSGEDGLEMRQPVAWRPAWRTVVGITRVTRF